MGKMSSGELRPPMGGGNLPAPQQRKRTKPANLYNAIRSIFIGVGFLFVSLLAFRFAPAGRLWWFWLLIPAFAKIGNGVAEYLRAKHERERRLPIRDQAAMPPIPDQVYLPPGAPGQPPASVTEGTTRTLGMPVERE
jgi:hypothetical protein